jgi:hypothetical protein
MATLCLLSLRGIVPRAQVAPIQLTLRFHRSTNDGGQSRADLGDACLELTAPLGACHHHHHVTRLDPEIGSRIENPFLAHAHGKQQVTRPIKA